jgi:hypothetical protein
MNYPPSGCGKCSFRNSTGCTELRSCRTYTRNTKHEAAERHQRTMKKILFLLALELAMFNNLRAQTLVDTNLNPPSISGGLMETYEALAASGLATATNYAVEPYLTYAPNAPSANRIGGGILVVYNVSQFVGAGIGADYLGQFSLVSANMSIKLPLHPFTFLGGSWTNVALVPFALAGVGTPLSGTSAGFAAITDTGAYISFGHLWGGDFNAGACYGRWDNAGAYSGPRYHFFLGWSKGF